MIDCTGSPAPAVGAGIIGEEAVGGWRLVQRSLMMVQKFFPTLVYSARLGSSGAELNRRLLRESQQLERDDDSGRRWSAKNYPGGYTSYNSASRMHELSPTFASL